MNVTGLIGYTGPGKDHCLTGEILNDKYLTLCGRAVEEVFFDYKWVAAFGDTCRECVQERQEQGL